MRLATLLFFLFTGPFLWSMGGVWVLEVAYEYNGQQGTGYLEVDYWPVEWDSLIDKEAQFITKFEALYGNHPSITIYSKLVDQSILAAYAKFPLHPFELVSTSGKSVITKDLIVHSLIRVWRKNDYSIRVFTKLDLFDTAWIAGEARVEYPLGDEIGCRLAVYIYPSPYDNDQLIREFSQLYMRKETLTSTENSRQLQLVNALKQRKVVLVELCGC